MIVELTNRSLLELSGKDAQSFLQNQFSNDVNALQEGVMQLNAFCQHQGKIIALFWLWREDEAFYLSFPKDLTQITTQRLNMFKLMSEVEIEDITDQYTQLGVIDEAGENSLKINDNQSLMVVEKSHDFELSDENNWEQACIENSLPEVSLTTSEAFVPQMLNLDIGEVGVSFTKGCYPGQEVVARLHYLGKPKRRMYAFECESEVAIGDKLVVSDSKSLKASGQVVRAVENKGKYQFLATLEVKNKDSEIRLGDENGAIINYIKAFGE